MELPIYQLNIQDDGTTGVHVMSLVENPAVKIEFLKFSKEQLRKVLMSTERREILGVAMLADTPIYRNNAPYGEHYVVFSKEVIRQTAQDFFKNKRTNAVNIEHDKNISDVVIFQSYITDESIGLTAPSKIGNVPDGSWIVGYKVNNPEVWEKAKSGEVKGFSIEGLFEYQENPDTIEGELNKLLDTLKKVK